MERSLEEAPSPQKEGTVCWQEENTRSGDGDPSLALGCVDRLRPAGTEL